MIATNLRTSRNVRDGRRIGDFDGREQEFGRAGGDAFRRQRTDGQVRTDRGRGGVRPRARDLSRLRGLHARSCRPKRSSLTLLIGDGLVVIVLIVLIAIELRRLRAARRAARAGARLHSRFVALFSLVAAIPAIVTAVVATVSVEWAINPRFMSDVAAFINESNQATQLYRESQCRALLRDVELTAGDIARSALLLRSDPDAVQGLFQLARQDARLRRRGADEERRQSARDRRRLGRQADRQTRSRPTSRTRSTARTCAAFSAPATSSSPSARSPAPRASSSTPRAASIRWRPRSPRTPRASPVSGDGSRRTGTAWNSASPPCS